GALSDGGRDASVMDMSPIMDEARDARKEDAWSDGGALSDGGQDASVMDISPIMEEAGDARADTMGDAGRCEGPHRPPLVFRDAGYCLAGETPFDIKVADLNRDRKLDLIIANASSRDVSVILGNGDGTFQAPNQLPVAAGPRSIAVADFNLDGKDDLAVGHE